MGRIRKETTRLKAGISREAKISNLVAAGLGNLAIWAAMEAEFPQIIEESSKRKQYAGKSIPFDKDERGKISRAINSVRGLLIKSHDVMKAQIAAVGASDATVKNATDIEFSNRHRFGWGIPALDYIYGHTRFIHVQDHPESKYEKDAWKRGLWRAGDPIIHASNDGQILPTRDANGNLLPLDLKTQRVEHGCPESFLSIWGGAPGVGKTRLAISACKGVNRSNCPILYCNGEADESDFRMWMGPDVDPRLFNLVTAGLLEPETIANFAYEIKPKVILIDSLQMLAHCGGSTGILRALTRFRLLKSEEKSGKPHIVFISQLNKQEDLAGSRMLAHIVDFVAMVTKVEGRKGVFLFECPSKNRGGETPRGALFRHSENGVECVSTGDIADAPAYKLQQPTGAIAEGVTPHPIEVQREQEGEENEADESDE